MICDLHRSCSWAKYASYHAVQSISFIPYVYTHFILHVLVCQENESTVFKSVHRLSRETSKDDIRGNQTWNQTSGNKAKQNLRSSPQMPFRYLQ